MEEAIYLTLWKVVIIILGLAFIGYVVYVLYDLYRARARLQSVLNGKDISLPFEEIPYILPRVTDLPPMSPCKPPKEEPKAEYEILGNRGMIVFKKG